MNEATLVSRHKKPMVKNYCRITSKKVTQSPCVPTVPYNRTGRTHTKLRGQAVLGEWERECKMWAAVTSVFLATFQSLPTTRIYVHD